jgi:ABC-2 type transport system permease protein
VRTIGNIAAIFRREMASYFLSPIAYVVICLFLLVNGWIFHKRLELFRNDPQQITAVLGAIFGLGPFWALLLSPVITMRLLAEEKRSGTLETLMTAPVTSFQVAAGKLLAAEAFFLIVWSTLLLDLLILACLGNPDYGPIIAIFIGIASLGLLMNGLGLLASALTRNQIIAVIVALVGNLLLLSLGMLRYLFPGEPGADRLFDFLGFYDHFTDEYYRGVIDLRFIALDLLGAGLAFFFAVRALEARRWR